MHYAILAGTVAGLVSFNRDHQQSCILVDPIPSAAAYLTYSAASQQQQPYQLGKPPAQWRGGYRIQCGLQPLPLFA